MERGPNSTSMQLLYLTTGSLDEFEAHEPRTIPEQLARRSKRCGPPGAPQALQQPTPNKRRWFGGRELNRSSRESARAIPVVHSHLASSERDRVLHCGLDRTGKQRQRGRQFFADHAVLSR